MSKFYSVVTRREIPDTGGKTVHHKVGAIKVTPNGGWFLQLFLLPGIHFQIFPNHGEELPVIDFDHHES